MPCVPNNALNRRDFCAGSLGNKKAEGNLHVSYSFGGKKLILSFSGCREAPSVGERRRGRGGSAWTAVRVPSAVLGARRLPRGLFLHVTAAVRPLTLQAVRRPLRSHTVPGAWQVLCTDSKGSHRGKSERTASSRQLSRRFAQLN